MSRHRWMAASSNVHGVRFGARSVAVAARPRAEVPAPRTRTRHRQRGDHLGRADLPRGAQRARPPRLRGRLRVQSYPPATQRRSRRDDQGTPNRLPQLNGRPSSRPPSRVHRLGFFQANQIRIVAIPDRRRTGPAPARSARLRPAAGLATCGVCRRNWPSTTTGRRKPPPATTPPAPARWSRAKAPAHLRVGGLTIDTAVAEAFLAALQPAALQACLAAAGGSSTATTPRSPNGADRSSRPAIRARRAERRYRAVDPDNRLVARGLETEWNTALQALADAEAELARRETARPKTLTPHEKSVVLALGDDLPRVWTAPTTTDGPKRLLRRLRVDITVSAPHRRPRRAHAGLERRRDPRPEGPIRREPPNRLAPTRTPSTWSTVTPPLSRRGDRAHPQPPRPPHRPRTVVHRR